MFWEDNEDKRKGRVGKKLADKRAERHGQVIEPMMEEAQIISDDGTVVTHELLTQQQAELQALKHLLVQQGKLLQELLVKDPVVVTQTVAVAGEVEVKKPKDFDMPVLNENISVCVIDKTGIEVGGGPIGKNQSEGENISDRIKKLRELKKNKKE